MFYNYTMRDSEEQLQNEIIEPQNRIAKSTGKVDRRTVTSKVNAKKAG